MKQPAASASGTIKVISGVIIVLTAGFLAASAFNGIFLLPGLILAVVILFCFLRAPIAYDLSDNRLSIVYRLGEKRFEPVVKCSLAGERVNMGVRLWGNGGLFAATGIFWSKKHGVFRAYITAHKPGELVLVETRGKKIFISPENPEEFIELAAHSNH